MLEGLFNAFNYLVPATGTVKGYNIQTDFNTTYRKNWQQTDIDADEFHPSGIFVDNSTSANPLTITIVETGQKIVIAGGGILQTMYPAPVNHTVTISGGNGAAGSGNASVTFVDFPVIPYQYGATTIASGGDVTEGSTTDAAVTGDNPGTISAKLRGLLKIFTPVIDLINGALVIGGNIASGVADAGNPVKTGGKYNLVVPTVADGQRIDSQMSAHGSLRVLLQGNTISAPDNIANNLISLCGTDNSATNGSLWAEAPYIFNGTSWDRLTKANAVSRIVSSAASTNATSAKASAGTIYSFDCYNNNAAARVLKIYNKNAAPVVGTDVPFRTIVLAPGKNSLTFPTGLYLSAGIAYALTVNPADSDTIAVALNDVSGLNIDYS